MRVIYITIYSLASGNGLLRAGTGSNQSIGVWPGYFASHEPWSMSKSTTNHFEKQSYHEMKCFNIAGKMQYQNSNQRIRREEESPFVQLWVAVTELTLNVLVAIQDCWLWVFHVSNNQLITKYRHVAIAFAIQVVSYLRIVVTIILVLVPSFTM